MTLRTDKIVVDYVYFGHAFSRLGRLLGRMEAATGTISNRQFIFSLDCDGALTSIDPPVRMDCQRLYRNSSRLRDFRWGCVPNDTEEENWFSAIAFAYLQHRVADVPYFTAIQHRLEWNVWMESSSTVVSSPVTVLCCCPCSRIGIGLEESVNKSPCRSPIHAQKIHS